MQTAPATTENRSADSAFQVGNQDVVQIGNETEDEKHIVTIARGPV